MVQTHSERTALRDKILKEKKMMDKSLKLSNSIKSNKTISFRVLAQIASAVPKRVKFNSIEYNGSDLVIIEGTASSDQDILKLISNLNNKKLISQASLASMTLPDQNTTQLQKGFVIACIGGRIMDLKNITMDDLKAKFATIDKKTLIKFGAGFGAILIFLIIYYAVLNPMVKERKEIYNDKITKENEIVQLENNIISLKVIKKTNLNLKKLQHFSIPRLKLKVYMKV